MQIKELIAGFIKHLFSGILQFKFVRYKALRCDLILSAGFCGAVGAWNFKSRVAKLTKQKWRENLLDIFAVRKTITQANKQRGYQVQEMTR